jgi:murein DD-endopeptidase MepM/ murein hydrolase activator NlpD
MKTEMINFNDFLNGNWKRSSSSKFNSNCMKFLSVFPYPISSKFGNQESFRNSGHSGIDFSMPKNTPLRSIKDGVVTKIVDYGENVNAGKTVMIKWEDGKTAIYGHLNRFADIKVGEHVSVGDLIGYSGNSGHVVGSNGGYHLHFGLKESGQYINPSPYIDHIENMNNLPQSLSLTNSNRTNTMNFSQLLNEQSSIYGEIFKSLKLNVVNLSIDNSAFIQYFQNFL